MIELLRNLNDGRRPALMLLAASLALALANAACRSPAPVTCQETAYPAVNLEVFDESDEPLIGASMRYRIDDGSWQEWPENLGRETVIRGQPGVYQVEIAKQGFESRTMTLEVPAEDESSCRPVAQAARLELARTPCPDRPSALSLTVDPPQDGLQASVRMPDSGQRPLLCQEFAGDACRRFSIEALELGQVELSLEGLPGLGAMQVVSNVVAYDTPAVELQLAHRGVQETAEVSGLEAIRLSFPVRRDEANCALADLRELATLAQDGPDGEAGDGGGRPPLALRYLGSLTMTDLGAAACQEEPVLDILTFGADLPAGTDLADVQVQVEYGEGWQTAACQFSAGRYLCQAAVPNPLLDRPFVARIVAGDEAATGLSLPFGGLCLVFE